MLRFWKNRRIINGIHRNIAKSAAHKNKLSINDMPHPKGLPIFGTQLHLMAAGGGTRLHEYAHNLHKELGPIFHDNLNNSDLVFISDPQLMRMLFLKLEGKYPGHILPDPWVLYEQLYGSKRGLFFMNGEEWLVNRRVMNKFLLKEGLESWLRAPIQEVIRNFLAKWKTEAGETSIIPDIESSFYRLSIDVITAVLIGFNERNFSNHYDELLTRFSEEVKKVFQTTTKLYGLPLNMYHKLNLKRWRDFKESVDTSLFLAQKVVTEMLHMKNLDDGLILKMKQENMSPDNIIRIVADLIIAAGDTTAYTSLWTLYLLSQNSNVVDEIRLNDIAYSKCVLKESMRLYPVAPFLTRIISSDITLGQYKLPQGMPIVASIYTSGRDENNFSMADKFLPYRWDRNDIRRSDLKNVVPSASLPFALGARSCIGKKIAMLQITEFIKQMVDNFDFKLKNDTKVNAVMSQVLVPDRPIILEFTPRMT